MECVFVVLWRIIKTRNVLELGASCSRLLGNVMWSEWSEGVSNDSKYLENASSSLLLNVCAHNLH